MSDYMNALRARMIARHTRAQIPFRRKRTVERPEDKPLRTWTPTPDDVLHYLCETKIVHKTLLYGIQHESHPSYSALREIDLDTIGALSDDIETVMLNTRARPVTYLDKPGQRYAAYLNRIVRSDPALFLCHLYATVFAHVSGGSLIAKRIQTVLSLSVPLKAHETPGGDALNSLRDHMYTVSVDWTDVDRERSVSEVDRVFEFGGDVLRILAQSSDRGEYDV